MTVFVHRYKWSHAKRRKKFRRLLKEGKVTVEAVHNGWLYTMKEETT